MPALFNCGPCQAALPIPTTKIHIQPPLGAFASFESSPQSQFPQSYYASHSQARDTHSTSHATSTNAQPSNGYTDHDSLMALPTSSCSPQQQHSHTRFHGQPLHDLDSHPFLFSNAHTSHKSHATLPTSSHSFNVAASVPSHGHHGQQNSSGERASIPMVPVGPLPAVSKSLQPELSTGMSAPFSEVPLAAGFRGIEKPRAGDYDASGLAAASPYVVFSSQSIIKEKRYANTPSLGFGALVCPGRTTLTGTPVIRREPSRCQNCGAFVNMHCSLVGSSGHWKCVFCKAINSSGGEYRAAGGVDLRNWPELVTSVVDYVDAGVRRPGFVSPIDPSAAAPVVLVLDDSLNEGQLYEFQSSLHGFLDSLSPSTRITFVTYGRTVSVYDLSVTDIAAADVLPGNAPLNRELLKMFFYGTGVYSAPVHVCVSVAHIIVSSLRPYKGDLPEYERERCLGTAVEVALAIIQGPSAELPRSTTRKFGSSSRVLVCAGGPPTLGPGALPHSESHPNYLFLERKATKHMEHLGQVARKQETTVDIFCAGTCPVRIPTLSPLVKASGGVLILHDDFGQTFGYNLQRAIVRATGYSGTLEIRSSKDVALTRVIGPGKEAQQSRGVQQQLKNDMATSVHMLSVEDTQAFALFMELKENLAEDYVYFQFASLYTSIYQTQVKRVVTVRLPTTSSLTNYLRSVQDEVAAVLIAKKTVLEAKTAHDAVETRASVDARMKDIALKLGLVNQKSKQQNFPSEISRLPELLFHLRRSPLLGNIVGHEDERSMLRNLFLQAGFDLSLKMLAPQLLMHREARTFEELPAYDLAMQSDTAIVLDHGTDIFIWTGLDIAADEVQSASAQAACRTLAFELSEQRFPAPRILAFKVGITPHFAPDKFLPLINYQDHFSPQQEGSSQARFLQARLIPAHKDTAIEKDVKFPQLQTLTKEQRLRLRVKFLDTDELSFLEWMRKINLVPPALLTHAHSSI